MTPQRLGMGVTEWLHAIIHQAEFGNGRAIFTADEGEAEVRFLIDLYPSWQVAIWISDEKPLAGAAGQSGAQAVTLNVAVCRPPGLEANRSAAVAGTGAAQPSLAERSNTVWQLLKTLRFGSVDGNVFHPLEGCLDGIKGMQPGPIKTARRFYELPRNGGMKELLISTQIWTSHIARDVQMEDGSESWSPTTF